MVASAIVRCGLVATACVAGGLLPVTYAAAADGEMCLGKAVTITARPGETVSGTTGPDVIFGSRGADTIRSGAGRDVICARGGADVIMAGAGMTW